MSSRARSQLGLVCALAGALLVVLVPPAGAQSDEGPAVRPIEVGWVDPDEVRVPQVVDELEPATVLAVRARAFPADTTGSVAQCVVGAVRRCGNRSPIRTDDRGVATFQYLVAEEIDPDGRCRLGSSARCVVEITVGDRVARVDTVFVDAAPPPGQVAVEPRTGVRPGESVVVEITGLPAGVELEVAVCAAPATSGSRCGAPGPQTSVRTDADGAAQVSLELDVDAVGEAEVACGRRTPCQVVVTGSTVGVRAAPVRLTFATRPGADHDSGRLAIGLVAAAVLGAAALRLIRSTDWSPPAEADGSLIDDAVWADLDAEAEAFVERETASG